jgi:hypothetical protein
MNTKKNRTISEAAAQAMGLGDFDATGKGSMDALGRGAMTAAPVATGAVAVPVSAPVVPNSVGAKGAAAPVASSKQTSSEEETEETEETEEVEEVEESVDADDEAVIQEAKAEFRQALTSLLGEENSSDELLNKLEGIFEVAVNTRVEQNVADIVESVDNNVKNYLETITESLVEKVDDYLDYVVEEWLQENAVAVEQGIKTQIAENFISGLKNLFENHYIDVPNEKYNVLDELYAKNRELEEKLNESVKANMNLKKEIDLTECAGIFVAESRDLADTQIAKLQNLMENITFSSPKEYREKLVTIKENYLNKSKVAPARTVEPEQTFAPVKSAPTTLVENYVGALGRLNKKV